GMYYNKKVDYVYLLWEDLVFQVENKNSNKNNDMYYPRFTKVIVDYFMAKDQAIPRRNKMFWHYARDDFMFTTVRVISKHQDTQVYGAILLQHLTNQAMLEYEAYMTYRATGEKTPKPKSTKKKADSESSPKPKPTQASKGKRIKTSAKGDKPVKMKQSATKSKGLTVLSEAALSEADQMKLATERSKKEFRISHASVSGDRVDIMSKTFSQGEDDEEKDEHDSEDDNDEHDNANDNDDEDDDQENICGETESDDDKDDFVHPNLSTYNENDQEEKDEEEKANDDDEVSSDQKVMGGEQEDEEDDELVSSLDSELSELKQTDSFTEVVSSIPGIVNNYLGFKMKDAVNVAVQLQSNKLREEAQAENDKFLKQIDSNIKAIIKDQVKAQAQASGTQSSFNEFLATPIDFSAFIMNRLKIHDLTQDVLTDPTYYLMKGMYKSVVELEYHLEEVFKATNDQLDWHNTEGRPYPHDLSKPLPLIQNARGRQVIPFDHFINNDLEYLKGVSLSKKYTTLITKTKAADYGHVKWIEYKVPRSIWSLKQVVYDKHAYWETYHWGPKRQKFYGYATNTETSNDVYSRHMIIAITSLKIMEFFGYKHMEEITVRRQDDRLFKFREGDFKRLRRQDIEDMLLLFVQGKLTNLNLDERFALNVALRMYTRRIII
nr:hypothetical protein [Tanacetum cinerariifolium]